MMASNLRIILEFLVLWLFGWFLQDRNLKNKYIQMVAPF